MTALRLNCLLLTLLWLIPQPAQPQDTPVVPPRKGNSETIELFNGQDLSGWIGHEKYWSVQDGEIVGRNTDEVKVSTYLLTKRSWTDFRLTFEFKLAQSEMHSGLALWGRIAPDHGDEFTYAGHLVMFPSNYGFYDLYGRKMIHENAEKAKTVGLQHDWNRIEVLAQGNRIRFALNGKLISDWREPEPERIHEAPIGLQLHSNKEPQEVRFRKLMIETFPEDRLVTVPREEQQAAISTEPPVRSVPADTPGLWTRHHQVVVPDALLQPIRHPKFGLTTLGVREEERDAFYALLQKVDEVGTSTLKLASQEFREARRNAPEHQRYLSRPAHEFPSFVDLYKNPEAYHGRVLTLRGHLRKLVKVPADQNPYGIGHYYEAWLYDENAQGNPAVIVCRVKDERLQESTETVIDFVSATGYFFKNYLYEAQDTGRFAPLLIAEELEFAPAVSDGNWFRLDRASAIKLAMAGVGLLIVGQLFWRIWRNHIREEREHRKVLNQVTLPDRIEVPESTDTTTPEST